MWAITDRGVGSQYRTNEAIVSLLEFFRLSKVAFTLRIPSISEELLDLVLPFEPQKEIRTFPGCLTLQENSDNFPHSY